LALSFHGLPLSILKHFLSFASFSENFLLKPRLMSPANDFYLGFQKSNLSSSGILLACAASHLHQLRKEFFTLA